mmetsp:Transcript_54718/g.108078  ORF Transcript_54718/g.108078 Transcript_54718/m.108078 type:complete len:324 (-) Transcript_54718:406-1377(-)
MLLDRGPQDVERRRPHAALRCVLVVLDHKEARGREPRVDAQRRREAHMRGAVCLVLLHRDAALAAQIAHLRVPVQRIVRLHRGAQLLLWRHEHDRPVLLPVDAVQGGRRQPCRRRRWRWEADLGRSVRWVVLQDPASLAADPRQAVIPLQSRVLFDGRAELRDGGHLHLAEVVGPHEALLLRHGEHVGVLHQHVEQLALALALGLIGVQPLREPLVPLAAARLQVLGRPLAEESDLGTQLFEGRLRIHGRAVFGLPRHGLHALAARRVVPQLSGLREVQPRALGHGRVGLAEARMLRGDQWAGQELLRGTKRLAAAELHDHAR